ncbi:MAG: hypothetical protein IJM49_02770 [Firmicutes bacterium]|nr:hypothetical protein [Bacillota bacterium]
MPIFKSSRGSASVEASLISPVVIGVIASLLLIGIRMTEKVRAYAAVNEEYHLKIVHPVMPSETVLRLKWMGIKFAEDPAD